MVQARATLSPSQSQSHSIEFDSVNLEPAVSIQASCQDLDIDNSSDCIDDDHVSTEEEGNNDDIEVLFQFLILDPRVH